MPYATNAADGCRTYFEDWGGDGAPAIVYTGLTDPLESAQENGLVLALRDDVRPVFADHRGHGRSDKPHDVAAYSLKTRVGDMRAVLDALGIERAHFLGFSWGARLGFAVGAYAPDRLLSLVLCGNQPYAWDPAWPFVPAITTALSVAQREGMQGFVESLESSFNDRITEPTRTRMLRNDPAAIRAAWESAMTEGPIPTDLGGWQIPCLIYMADADDMHDNAARAAAEIPHATFLSLPGATHLSAPEEVDLVLPRVRTLVRLPAVS